jgi:hypothetical protein
MDEDDQAATTTTTTTETTYLNTPPENQGPGPQPYAAQSAPVNPPPVNPAPAQTQQTQRRVAVQEQPREPQPPAENITTPPPRKVAEKERSAATRTSELKPSDPPKVASNDKVTGDLPYAKPVPGKPGYVFSPYDKNGGYVDVTGYSPGQKVKDPYSGKVFLVP